MTVAYAETGARKVSEVPWGSVAVLVDGHDVTKVDGVPTVVESYQLLEPGGYGPAAIRFPKFSPFVKMGVTYPWLRLGASVVLRQRRADGTMGRRLWKGYIARPARATVGFAVECDGLLVGRASNADKQSELVYWTKDAGLLISDAIRLAGCKPVPGLGITTGIDLAERSLDGGSVWDYALGILALAQTENGNQLTIRPNATGSGFDIRWKSRETVHATLMVHAAGVDVDLAEDIAEAPNRFFGYGRDPKTNEFWTNAAYPGLMQGEAPDFPGTLSEGDTGDDVDLLQSKLSQMGYLARADALGSEFDATVTKAVKRLQRQAGLAVTGVVNLATWRALYDVDATGPSLRGAKVLPLAWDPRTEKYLYSANGSRLGLNPEYDPSVVPVDRTIDFGYMSQERATDWCQMQVDRLLAEGPGLAGTITLTADIWAGAVTHADVLAGTAEQMSRLDLTEGMNVRVLNVDGDRVKMHVAVVDVTGNDDGPPTVRLTVDERARDALELADIVKRRRESRVRPHRAFKASRKSEGRKALPEATKDFGWLWRRVALPSNQFVVVPVPAGQAGTVYEIAAKLGTPREFVCAVTNDETTPAWWRHLLPDGPFATHAWESDRVRSRIEDARVLLGAWGTDEKPCGRNKAGDLTGKFLDEASFGYHTLHGVLWMMFYVRGGDSSLRPQRLMRPQLESGS